MLRKLSALAAVGALALGLAGCSSAPSSYQSNPDNEQEAYSDSLYESTITLKDGRKITCIILDIYEGGGLSCDWTPEAESEFE